MVRKILTGVEEERFVEIAANIAHYHHEKVNGKGYPEGFTREQIPLFGRIAAIADSFDVMSLDRKYQKALKRDEIIEELNNNAGTQDPSGGTQAKGYECTGEVYIKDGKPVSMGKVVIKIEVVVEAL